MTSLSLRKHSISELQNRESIAAILDTCERSPVFIVVEEKLSIVIKKTKAGWSGFSADRGPLAVIDWTEDQVKHAKGAYLIYHEDHASLSSPGQELKRNCADGENDKAVWSDGRIKLYELKS